MAFPPPRFDDEGDHRRNRHRRSHHCAQFSGRERARGVRSSVAEVAGFEPATLVPIEVRTSRVNQAGAILEPRTPTAERRPPTRSRCPKPNWPKEVPQVTPSGRRSCHTDPTVSNCRTKDLSSRKSTLAKL